MYHLQFCLRFYFLHVRVFLQYLYFLFINCHEFQGFVAITTFLEGISAPKGDFHALQQ